MIVKIDYIFLSYGSIATDQFRRINHTIFWSSILVKLSLLAIYADIKRKIWNLKTMQRFQKSRAFSNFAASVLLIAFAGSVAAQDVVTGVAVYRERIMLAPDAVLKATLEDVSRADAEADIISEVTIENLGAPPYTFELSYDPATIKQKFTYSVRVSITEDGALKFVSDTANPVLTRGASDHVDIMLKMVRSVATMALPGTFYGELPCADCNAISYRLALKPDNTFFLQKSWVGSDLTRDVTGKWSSEPKSNILILDVGEAQPVQFKIENRTSLRLLDLNGNDIESSLNYTLVRESDAAKTDASLINTYWKLVQLGDQVVEGSKGKREPHIILHGQEMRYAATVGCNKLVGKFQIDGETLNFLQGAATMMACIPPLGQLEHDFGLALAATKGWNIDGQNLEILDGTGAPIARFEAVYLR